MNKPRILLVEDDTSLGPVLKSYLEMNTYEVDLVDDGREVLPILQNKDFDVCIFDVMLPGKDGFSIAKEVSDFRSDLPFVFLTAKTLREDMIKGFKLGADDYITKPFDTEVLIFKLNAILHRNKVIKPETWEFQVGKYNFYARERKLLFNEECIKLTPKENALLKILCENMNELTQNQIALMSIWGNDSYFNKRSMDVFISKLRKYLSQDKRIFIENVHGSGYILYVQD